MVDLWGQWPWPVCPQWPDLIDLCTGSGIPGSPCGTGKNVNRDIMHFNQSLEMLFFVQMRYKLKNVHKEVLVKVMQLGHDQGHLKFFFSFRDMN